jgi:CRISPR-associated protein Csb1
MKELTKLDHYLSDDGPVALVIREYLMPVEGPDGVLFPATFAAGDGFAGGYNIDGDLNGTNVCLIDSVGSQANRIEPLFAGPKYKALVPQIVVKAGEKEVNLLEAGHRAGDAIVRCSELRETLQDAFKAVLKGDAELLAKIAPTSLVFGVWDSRDTQAKLPRLVASNIRAFDVRKLRRHAQYIPAVDYVGEGVLDEPEDLKDAEGRIKGKHPFAQRGFSHIPISKPENTHGGVIATGGVRRDATLGLAALRLLSAGKDEQRTLALRRYILGLALTAFTHNPSGYLRQGCLLVLDPGKPREFVEVYPAGERKPVTLTHDAALNYATATAKAFGVGDSQTVEFDKERARSDVTGQGDLKRTAARRGRRGAGSQSSEAR